MSRLLPRLGACAAALTALAAVAPATLAQTTTPVSPARTPVPAALTRIACHSTLVPGARSVSVTSVMRHLPGTQSLQVRFTLLEKQPGSPPKRVADGDLGRWLSPSDPTLGRLPADVWKLTKTVYNVDAPARYRFRVAFRWRGAGGRQLAIRTLRTGACAERDLRPDVLVRRVRVRALALAPGLARYTALIANRGGSPSGAFLVQFVPGAASGGTAQTASVASLRPGARTRLSFTGAACEAQSPPTVVADPTDEVDDANRSNNVFTVHCPAAAANVLSPLR